MPHPPSGDVPSKSVLRQQALQIRADAHRAQGAEAPVALLDHFLADIPLSAPKGGARPLIVAGYYPLRSELDPLPLVEVLHQRGCLCALPRVVAAEQPLSFHEWVPGSATQAGPFGTRVPLAGARPVVPDLVLVPLLSFDLTGMRLGFGGGFYDRTLQALRSAGKVLAVGVAFAAQERDVLPYNEHDQSLDWVVTEKGSRCFERTPR